MSFYNAGRASIEAIMTNPRHHSIQPRRLFPVLILAFAASGGAAAATLSAGPSKTYVSPCAAFAAAKDGDTIEIVGNWTYSGDVCAITRNDLVIRGVEGRPTIDAAGRAFGGKGTWVVTGNNVTVENVEMLGAKVPDHNGAAIRLEGTGFTLRRAFIHDNENGILSGANPASRVLIEFSEFGHNGAGDGQSHNLYIGNVNTLIFRYSYSHDANIGHDLKSRAATNLIAYSRFSSTPPGRPGNTASGKPSFEIDLPNGGTSYVIGNVIQQPALNDNSNILAYGEEGPSNPRQDLYVINNIFLNDYDKGTFVMVGGQVSKPVLIQNNFFGGPGDRTNQGKAIDKDNLRSKAPTLIERTGAALEPVFNDVVAKAGQPMNPWNSGTDAKLAPAAKPGR
jgi:hypothetical protein